MQVTSAGFGLFRRRGGKECHGPSNFSQLFHANKRSRSRTHRGESKCSEFRCLVEGPFLGFIQPNLEKRGFRFV
jgi:hypothetical protein